MDTPKNIRQVGDVDDSHKIYVEDYVVTHTRSIGKEHNNKAAVLLGHKNVTHNDVETFINGMVVIEGFSLSGEAEFSNEKWSMIYDDIKEFYEDEEIVGWLYIGDSYEVQADKRLINIHANNFNGKNALFMNYNYIEKEETFYDFINNAFVKRKGFYIYYKKNETMHNYMLAANSGYVYDAPSDERVIKDFREIMTRHSEVKESRKLARSVYAAGMLVAAVALLVGTTMIYRYNDNPFDETADTVTKEASVATGQAVISNSVDSYYQEQAAAGRNDLSPDQSGYDPTRADNRALRTGVAATTDGGSAENDTADNKQLGDPAEDRPAEGTGSEDTDSKEAVTTFESHSFYIVKPGDTLGSISEKIYNSVHFVDIIKEINNIEDVDRIDVGQKLMLPDE